MMGQVEPYDLDKSEEWASYVEARIILCCEQDNRSRVEGSSAANGS